MSRSGNAIRYIGRSSNADAPLYRSTTRRATPQGPRLWSARLDRFGLRLEHLAALVHAGLEIDVVGAAQFAGILVLDIGWLLQCIRRAAHATPRGRCFSSWNGHVGVL